MSQTFETILQDAVDERVFPGASVHFAQGDRELAVAHGGLTYESAAPTVTPDTLYDLASLTKLFTVTAFLAVAHEHGLDVETPARHYLPAFDRSDKSAITLRHLMQHNAGIELAIQSLADAEAETWLPAIANAPLHAEPGARVLYCCTNYWLLARIAEQVSGTTLDVLFSERILTPLGMARTTLEPLSAFTPAEIAPTEVDGTTGTTWQGVVHDEAARAWGRMTGTCAGNSGLFGTARDVARFGRMWLREGEGVLPASVVRRALTDLAPEGGSPTAPLGWRGWSWQKNNLTFAPPASWGHAGFTGPTLWIAPQRAALGVVLNNRVHPTRHGPRRMIYHRRLNDVFEAPVSALGM